MIEEAIVVVDLEVVVVDLAIGQSQFVQCQICYKPGHEASYCCYRHSYEPYGSHGSTQQFTSYGGPHSNVWTCPPIHHNATPNALPPLLTIISSMHSGLVP